MSEWLLNHEPQVRLSCFFGVLGLMALWELVAPRRALTASKALRWASNLSLVVLNSVLLRLLFRRRDGHGLTRRRTPLGTAQ